jgi:peptide/nickel transport system substrate-binding protein
MFNASRKLIPFALVIAAALPAQVFAGPTMQENAFWKAEVESGDLPPVAERIPDIPFIVDLEARNRKPGVAGGTLNTMVTRSKDIRQMVVYGYARLVGYDADYTLMPDILAGYENDNNKVFTLRIREGHRWSDGHLFTSADFEYWWNDVANNDRLSPAGPPDFLRIEGELPTVTFPDELTVVYAWDNPNPNFLQSLAQARPPFIFRPAHFLKKFHEKFAAAEALAVEVDDARVNSWAALHNKRDNMYKFDNHELPTLQPWMNSTSGKKIRHLFVRNPYYHRIDKNGVQLPYIDVVEMEIVAPGLVAAKSNAGQSDLQARGLGFRDIAILRKGESDGANYNTLLWSSGVASQIAIYPNLNVDDEVWRAVMRDVRVRRALSLAIDRKSINRALYFKLAKPGAMTVLPYSPFFEQKNRDAWAAYDIDAANALLDEAGLDKRDGKGIRLLPDGRQVEIVIETAGERQEVENALQIITDNWAEVGVRLIMRPLDRDILRNRVYSGTSMAAVWFGWDNGLPQSYTSPSHLAPRHQDFFAWPKWGQYYQTNGEAGAAPDMPEPIRLMELAMDWDRATTKEQRDAAWREMLEIHANQVYGIGILAEAPQPVVINKNLRNVPKEAIWTWAPGAHFGIHRPDEFYFAPDGTN